MRLPVFFVQTKEVKVTKREKQIVAPGYEFALRGIPIFHNHPAPNETRMEPEQINDCLGIPHVGLTELNRMYQAAEKLKRPDLDRLAAAVLMAKPEYAMQVRHLAENLELFDFIPNIKTPEELGKFMIQKSGHFEYDPNLDGFYDYAKYGEQRVREQAGEFNERGYIGYTGVLSLDELMMEDPAEQYQKEQEEQWIGGMT